MEKLRKNKVLNQFFSRFPEELHWKILKKLAIISIDYITSIHEDPKEIRHALDNLSSKFPKQILIIKKRGKNKGFDHSKQNLKIKSKSLF